MPSARAARDTLPLWSWSTVATCCASQAARAGRSSTTAGARGAVRGRERRSPTAAARSACSTGARGRSDRRRGPARRRARPRSAARARCRASRRRPAVPWPPARSRRCACDCARPLPPGSDRRAAECRRGARAGAGGGWGTRRCDSRDPRGSVAARPRGAGRDSSPRSRGRRCAAVWCHRAAPPRPPAARAGASPASPAASRRSRRAARCRPPPPRRALADRGSRR